MRVDQHFDVNTNLTLKRVLSHRVLRTAVLVAILIVLHLESPVQFTFADDYFQQLQEKLGVAAAEVQSSDNPQTSLPMTPGDGESLPPPVQGTSSTDVVEQSKSGLPAVSVVPTPFLSREEASNASANSPVPTKPQPAVDKPYLGVTIEQLQGGGVGMRVVEVTRNSPGWKAGITPGDNLLAIDGIAITDLDQLASEILKHAPGDVLRCLIDRRGRTVNLPVVLGSSTLAGRVQGQSSAPSGVAPYTPIGPGVPREEAAGLNNDQGVGQTNIGQPQASLGVTVERLSAVVREQLGIPVTKGAIVQSVAPSSAAMRAGLRRGDCIVEVDGTIIQSDAELFEWVLTAQAGQISQFRFYRGRTLMTASVRLASIQTLEEVQSAQRLQPDMPAEPQGDTSKSGKNLQIQSLENQIEAMRLELEKAQLELESLKQLR